MTTSPDAAHRRAVAERLEEGSYEACCTTRPKSCREMLAKPQDWCDDCALREAARLLRGEGER